MAVTGRGQGGRSLVARLDPLVEERLHFGDEDGIGELIGENRRETDGNRGGHRIGCESPENL